MLIKEYRIPLPLSVDEYKIAQLYMIAKISRDETRDASSGVQILINEPYEDGPNGSSGQYTKKVYYIREYLPGWIKSLLSKSSSSLMVEEEAWNAYPYTKTRYTSPFVEKFFIEIDTVYCPDIGQQQNVFNLSPSELDSRTVDIIDVVKDTFEQATATGPSSLVPDEDPTVYRSHKTGRGPLSLNWLDQCARALSEGDKIGIAKDIMCAYKLCKVDFRYWGMQTKLEKFIHDHALRKTMLKAHRRAWLWQDEWYGLTMDDVRAIERQTQQILRSKIDPSSSLSPTESTHSGNDTQVAAVPLSADSATLTVDVSTTSGLTTAAPEWKFGSTLARADSEEEDEDDEFYDCLEDLQSLASVGGLMIKWSSLDLLNEEELTTEFTNTPAADTLPLKRSCSEKGSRSVVTAAAESHISSCPGSPSPASYVPPGPSTQCRITTLLLVVHAGSVVDTGSAAGAKTVDVTSKKSDVTTLKGSFECVIRQHYPTMRGRVAVKLVPCPSITSTSLALLSSLSPYSFDSSPCWMSSSAGTETACVPDSIPVGALPVLSAVCGGQYAEALRHTIATLNLVYSKFVRSQEGRGFAGSVSIIGDSMGSILAYDALISAPQSSSKSANTEQPTVSTVAADELKVPTKNGASGTGEWEVSWSKLQFQVRDLFTFGSPLGLLLMYRQLLSIASRKSTRPADLAGAGTNDAGKGVVTEVLGGAEEESSVIERPQVQQMYNLFHASDPMATRLEPLLCNRFALLPPVNVARYHKYPLGNGMPYHLLEVIQMNWQVFGDEWARGTTIAQNSLAGQMRRMSEASLFSNSSALNVSASAAIGASANVEPLSMSLINSISQKWWGQKRLDYALYCPDDMSSIPMNALPHLFHASYWESYDVVAFILRQIAGFDMMPSIVDYYFQQRTTGTGDGLSGWDSSQQHQLAHRTDDGSGNSQQCEKWIRKRTSVKLNKLKIIGPNHRANDIIVKEGSPQTVSARFMYGTYDVITLTGEKVDIHVMNNENCAAVVAAAAAVAASGDGSSTTESGRAAAVAAAAAAEAAAASDWTYLSTVVTDKTGRVVYTLPEDKSLGYGIHHIKMIVRGDHTSVDLRMAVVPPATECVVFSIDGSFTASVSVTGRDPKIRAGAVDVVRQWQELGYLILYISARPDMQQQMVLSWLAQHNFPNGLTVFAADRFTTDPLAYKTAYLKSITQEHGVIISAAYGSSKDVAVYTAVGVKPWQLYIVGAGKSAHKKYHQQATLLTDGYASHLSSLQTPGHGRPRPAHGNARMVLLPRLMTTPTSGGGNAAAFNRQQRGGAKRTTSFPLSGGHFTVATTSSACAAPTSTTTSTSST